MHRFIIGFVVGVGLVGQASAAATDCQLGQRYLDLAKDRADAHETDEALGFLRQSIEACPTYESYERLGELAADAPKTNEEKLEAARSFEAAYAAAGNNAERVTSLYRYARLLSAEGSPAYAYKVILQARALDPGNQPVAEFAAKVENEYLHPTPEGIKRQVRFSMLEPQVALLSPTKSSGSVGGAPGRVSGPAAQPPAPKGPSISIPITFRTASVEVDPQTRPNIEALAHALADASMASHSFVFVGHSDQRGTEAINVPLSLQRAQSVTAAVESVEPSLKGRITVEGRGSKEPLNPGSDEAAWQANRRLQVLVR